MKHDFFNLYLLVRLGEFLKCAHLMHCFRLGYERNLFICCVFMYDQSQSAQWLPSKCMRSPARFHGLSDTNYSIFMMTMTYITCAFPYYISQIIKKTLFNALDLCRTRRRLNNPAIGPGQPWLVTTGTATTGDEDDKDDKRKHVSGVILKWRMWTWGWGISHVYYVMGMRVRSLAMLSG